jgi:hypothetical protein
MKQFRFFKIVDGVRTPTVIELDDQMTFVREYDATAVPRAEILAKKTPDKPDTPARVIALEMARWTVAEILDNPIPGSDDLRVEYFRAKAALQAKYKAEGASCPGCELGRLMRQFREKLRLAGHLAQFE